MARSEKDALRALADKWTREAYDMERSAGQKHRDWTNLERRLMDMHARIKRICANDLKEELNKVRRD